MELYSCWRIDENGKKYPDCGDNSCLFCPPEHLKGMRTNGGCRCLDKTTPQKFRIIATRIAAHWKERALGSEARMDRVVRAVISHLVALGPCVNRDDDDDSDGGVCGDPGCTYCNLERVLHENGF